MTMDHVEAIRTRAAERYALKQLSAPETEEFEEHFFSCPECAEEVRWVTMFEANAKRVVGRKVRETAASFVPIVSLEPGPNPVFLVPEYATSVVFSIGLPGDGWRAEHVSLSTGAGTARFTISVPAEQISSARVTVLMPARELDPGRHVLTLVSGGGDYEEYTFGVELS